MNGYEISKTQYGQHTVAKNVPIGDAFKAASTDCLKKCASLFGVALDVYWSLLDSEEKQGKIKAVETKLGAKERFENGLKMIKAQTDISTLVEWWEKIKKEKGVYSEDQKEKLINAINGQIEKLQN